jgi:CysZ protein
MLAAARLAFRDILSPPFRRVLWKALGLTLALLAAIWILIQSALLYLLALPFPWLETALSILSGIGLLIGLAFLVAPATALFAGLFLDEVAEVVERTHYPDTPPGRALPLGRSIVATLNFTLVVVLVNLLALPLVFLVGFGIVVFFVANAYLLGREYFEMAALRFHDRDMADRLRRRHAGRLFVAGLMIAAVLAVPLVNLLTPLFATAFMVHLHKRIAAREARAGILADSTAAR